MNTGLQNGSKPVGAKRPIKLTAPESTPEEIASPDDGTPRAITTAGDAHGADAHGIDDMRIAPSAAMTVDIAPQGESYIFGSGLSGHTMFYMINLGPGEAEVCMTWQGRHAPQMVRMLTNRHKGCEFYCEEFVGAKVTLINLSPEARVRLRVTQSA